MSISNIPLYIDELIRHTHCYLTEDDDCYYTMTYTSNVGGFAYNDDNNLISNLKKKLDRKGTNSWQYKVKAIRTIGEIYKDSLPEFIDFNITSIIPIPPSKTKADPLYDDRLNKILSLGCVGHPADVRDLILTRQSVEAAHIANVRPSIADIKANYMFDEELVIDLKPVVMLFDDVLTTGAHYIACKQFIQDRFPDVYIYGFFIARRVHQPIDEIFPLLI
jgi:hypothetical protein